MIPFYKQLSIQCCYSYCVCCPCHGYFDIVQTTAVVHTAAVVHIVSVVHPAVVLFIASVVRSAVYTICKYCSQNTAFVHNRCLSCVPIINTAAIVQTLAVGLVVDTTVSLMFIHTADGCCENGVD